MTHEEKIDYMYVAVRVTGYGLDKKGVDMLVSLYELVIEKEGETDLKSMIVVQSEVKKRADIRHQSELLDKVSVREK